VSILADTDGIFGGGRVAPDFTYYVTYWIFWVSSFCSEKFRFL